MQTTGEYLKNNRLLKGYTIEEVAYKTKIKADYIESIENDSFGDGLSDVYVKGFLKSYATVLGIEKEKVLALYRRDKEKKLQETNNISYKKPLNKTKLLLTPKLTIVILSIIVISSFTIFFGFQVADILSSPNLTLEKPEYIFLESKLGGNTKDVVIEDLGETVLLTGVTDKDSIVSINNEEVKLVNEIFFEKEIKLSEGNNTIVIKSENGFEKSSVINISVVNKNNN